MCKETRDLDDCITEAKEAAVATLEGEANYLRRYGVDNLAESAFHEAIDEAVPSQTNVLLEVFGSADHLWHSEPEGGFGAGDDHGIIGFIGRVIYDAINVAVYEWANELEGDTFVCEAAYCESTDDHEPCPSGGDHCIACRADTDVRCTAHCGSVGACERCAVALLEEARQ